MQRHNKLYVNIIAVVLVICTLCGTAAAADLSPAVSSSPPVGVVIENSTAVFSLKDNSSQYYKYSLEIMDADKENYLLCDNFEPSETARLSNITKDSDYSLRLELYGEETVSFYEGSFSADAFDAVTVSLSKTGSKKNTEKMSETEIDSLFEMTDEQYEKVFSSLDIPSFISEDEAKAAKHVERLKEYEDSYDKIGYKNADGTNTLYIFSSPVKYMDDSGRLMDADPNISETADSTVKAQGYSYVNDYGELKTYFADSLSDNKGVKIQKNETELEFGFCVPEKKEGNTLTKLFSSVSEIFSEPKNKAMLFTENREKKLGYNEVSNDANIIASPTTSGAMQTLILEDVPEDNRLTFWVSADGLTPKADDGKKSVVFSSESSECFTVGNIELRDSAQGEQAENGLHFSTENTVEIKQSGTDGTLVEITLDNDLLTAPSTVYPVSVTLSADSGTAVQSAETVQTAAAASEITAADAQADTSAARTLPSEWYYDSTTCQYYQIGDEVGYSYFQDRTVFSNGAAGNADDKYLLLGYDTYYTNGYYDTTTCQNVGSGYNTCTGYVFMKCDVSSLSIDPKMVDDVQLVLREGSGNSTPMTAELVRVTSPWTENNVSINHVRNCDNEYTGNTEIAFEQSGTGIENEAEITYMVTDHLLNAKGKGGGQPNYGFLLRSTASGKFSKHICSSEHGTTSYRPKIVLLYEDPFPLELNVLGHGQILDANQNQWYSFTPKDTAYYSISTLDGTDTYGRLYDSSLNLLTSDDDSGEELNFNIIKKLEAGKTYYIRVSGLRDLDEGFYFINVGFAFDTIFDENTEDINQMISEIDIILNNYLQEISPPRYCNGVEITSSNKSSTNYQGENIYLFLYEWYEEHIWPYEKELPRWANSAEINEEATKRAALNAWSEKVYGETTWEGIVNGIDNCVDVLYYEVINIDKVILPAIKQVVLGNYTDDVSITGTAGQVILSFFGVDVVADLRDITYDVSHWEWSWSHAGQTLIDLVAVAPVIGAAKNYDDLVALSKNIDSISELAGSAQDIDKLFGKIDELVLAVKSTGRLEELLDNTQLLVKWASHTGENHKNIVVLGKFANDSSCYYKRARAFGASYFLLPDKTWSELSKLDNGNAKLWNVNKSYIETNISKNSEFYFSHDPNLAYDADSGFGKELELLQENGYKFSTTPNADGFWYAYK